MNFSRRSIERCIITLTIFLCTFPSLSAQFQTVGRAAYNTANSTYTLTQDTCHIVGAVWSYAKADLSQPFEVDFELNFGSNNGTGINDGGDGITFVFHNDPRGFKTMGCSGGVLGYGNKNSCMSGISPSIGWEWDTHSNSILDPPLANGADHLMCIMDGDIAYTGQGDFGFGQYQNIGELENGQPHKIRITWTPGINEVNIYMNRVLRRTERVNIAGHIGTNMAYWGWTASTWGETNLQTVKVNTQPFPIELGDFYGEKFQDEVQLSWLTMSEINNDYFVVERSIDGQAFEAIGEIVGAGTTEDMQIYSFTDRDLRIGTHQYRLRQVDFDGVTSYSPVIKISIEATDLSTMAVIYPNQTPDVYNLLLKDSRHSHHLTIFDLQGRILLDTDLEGEVHQLLTHHWSNGLYFAHITSTNGEGEEQIKFVVD